MEGLEGSGTRTDLGQPGYDYGATLADISRSVVQIFRNRVGRGPTEAKTYWAGQDVLLVLMSGGVLRSEQTLWDAGHDSEVAASRAALQETLEQELSAAIERVTGRKVITFMAASRRDPELTAEIFILEPKRRY